MVEPSIFLDVLGIAPTFPISDDIIVFSIMESRDLPSHCVKIGKPSMNRFWKSGNGQMLFRENECDKQSPFVDKDGPSPAKSPDNGNLVFLHFLLVENHFGFSGDSHYNGAWRSDIYNAKALRFGAQESLFKLKLLKNGHASECDEMKFSHVLFLIVSERTRRFSLEVLVPVLL